MIQIRMLDLDVGRIVAMRMALACNLSRWSDDGFHRKLPC